MKWFRRDDYYYLINMTNGNIHQISIQPPENYNIVKNVDEILYIIPDKDNYEVCGVADGITFTTQVLYQNNEFHIKDYDPTKIIRAIHEEKCRCCAEERDSCDDLVWIDHESNNNRESDNNVDESSAEDSDRGSDFIWYDKKIRYINSPIASDTIEVPSDTDLDIDIQHVQIQSSPPERPNIHPERPDNLL